MRGSIRLRLSLFYGGLLALTLLLFCTVVYLVFRHRLYEHLEGQLRADGAGAMLLLLEEFFESEQDDEEESDEESRGPHGFEMVDLMATEVYFHLIGPDGATLQLSPNLKGRLLRGSRQALPTQPRLTTVTSPTLGTLRQFVLPARVGRETYWVVVAKSLAPVESALGQLLTLFALFLPGAVALVGYGGFLVSGRALSPIDEVIAAARAIREGDLSRRLAFAGPTDELKALADAFDEMIVALESLVAAERRFVADASHELRTPLTVIDSCLQVCLREPDASYGQLQEALTVVRRESRTMARLVEDLLTLARADAGEEQLRLGAVPLAALVEEVRDTVQWVNNGHTLDIQVAEDLTVYGDEHRLAQLLRGLLDNAFKYSPATGIVSLKARAQGPWVQVEVADEGPGIAPEHLPHLFDRFYRVDKARSRDQGGSGLGLAICRWIAQSHGGQVSVDSTVGQGTTFRVMLPAAPPR